MSDFTDALLSEKKSNLIPEEDNYFGPLVGSWKFSRTEPNEKGEIITTKGEWIFQWVLEGKMIQDIFIWPPRTERDSTMWDGEYGTTVRCYNPNTHHWEITYINGGYVGRFEAVKEGDKIVLTENVEKKTKWVFSEIKQDSFSWDSYQQQDDNSWIVNESLRLVRA